MVLALIQHLHLIVPPGYHWVGQIVPAFPQKNIERTIVVQNVQVKRDLIRSHTEVNTTGYAIEHSPASVGKADLQLRGL